MKTQAKILICYNAPVSIFSIYNGKPSENGSMNHDLSESDFSKNLSNTIKSLEEKFTHVESLAIDRNVERNIKDILKIDPDIIFNFVESVEGIASFEYCFAGLYELLEYSYTGNIPSCLGNCLNKERTKNILRSFRIPTPKSVTVKRKEKLSEENFDLKYPVILKLLNEDASIGISELSVVNDFLNVAKRLNFLFDTYRQDVIIEEYIEGRELNVAVLGNQVLPISEIEFNGLPEELPKIVTYESKWIAESVYYEFTKPKCPAKIPASVKKEIEKIAIAAFDAMNCRDYARVDIRLNKKNEPFVIEVNPNPDISTDSGFSRAAAAANIAYSELLFKIAGFALTRRHNDTQIKAS
jgi:D-alanine-D-alanine ligase